VVIIGGVLQENPFFVPPDEFLLEIRERLSFARAPAWRAEQWIPATSTGCEQRSGSRGAFDDPAAWVGREPSAVAAGLADVLVGSLHLDFAFVACAIPTAVRPSTSRAAMRGKHFRNGLHRHLAAIGHASRKEVVPGRRGRSGAVPQSRHADRVNADGGLVAVACDRSDFPSETDQLSPLRGCESRRNGIPERTPHP